MTLCQEQEKNSRTDAFSAIIYFANVSVFLRGLSPPMIGSVVAFFPSSYLWQAVGIADVRAWTLGGRPRAISLFFTRDDALFLQQVRQSRTEVGHTPLPYERGFDDAGHPLMGTGSGFTRFQMPGTSMTLVWRQSAGQKPVKQPL